LYTKGVGHNVAFLRDCVRNDAFISGHYSTSFIPKYYPKGFHGVQLTAQETDHLAVLAAAVHKQRYYAGYYNKTAITQGNDEQKPLTELVVVLGGSKGTPYYVGIDTFNDFRTHM
jgi:acetyl/propionyl-CoA carboxylase alpha subunit